MFTQESYSTTRVPSPTPRAPIASAKRSAVGKVKRSGECGSDKSPARSAKALPGMWAFSHAARPLSMV